MILEVGPNLAHVLELILFLVVIVVVGVPATWIGYHLNGFLKFYQKEKMYERLTAKEKALAVAKRQRVTIESAKAKLTPEEEEELGVMSEQFCQHYGEGAPENCNCPEVCYCKTRGTCKQ